jgi:transposase InsO family protein
VKEGCENLKGRFLVHENLLYTVDSRGGTPWKMVVHRELEEKLITYVHLEKGHAGTDKCVRSINAMFHLKNLGRKTRKLLALCEVCQKVKFPNWKYDVETRPHLPERKGQLVSVDFYGPVPSGRGGVRYLFVCLNVFTKFIKLYTLKSATTKACLQKIADDYVPHVVKPETILSDHGTQYTSRKWIDGLNELGIDVRFTPIGNPQSNPVERFTREIEKACHIYCEKNQKMAGTNSSPRILDKRDSV